MIDPFTAITAATTAFKTVKRLVDAGREMEDVVSQLSTWYGSAADIMRAEQQRKNPPIYAKVFKGKTIEQEALDIIIYQKTLKEQEKQLQVLIDLRFGHGTWEEMIQLRRKIKREREASLYRYHARKQAFIDSCLLGVGIGLFGLIAIVIFYAIGAQIGRW